MKKLLLSTVLLAGLGFGSKATIHTVSTVGFTFSPATVTASVGDTVAFVIGGIHNATEVSSTTWSAGGTTALSGGFAFSPPGNALVVTAPGTRYYVCTIHVATMGMKGQINVTATGTNDLNSDLSVAIYPNPANEVLNINVSNSSNQLVNMDIVNLLGAKVMDCGGNQILSNGVKKVDVSALPRGVYFLNIVSDNRTKSIRFVKK